MPLGKSLLPVFKPSSFHWSNLAGFHYADPKTAGVTFFLARIFVISWNAVAMEAAACYVGECRDPHRDAKIALTAEGLYGVFVYIGTAGGVHRRARRLAQDLRPADPLHQLRGPHLRQRPLGAIPDRDPAGVRVAAVRAQRHHGRRPLAVPGGRGPDAAPLVRAQEQPPRPGPGHAVQPGVLHGGGPARLPGPDLHLLQRRLSAGHRGRPGRVLPDAPVPAGPGGAVPDAGLVPLAGPGLRALPGLRLLRGRLERPGDRGRPGRVAHPVHPGDRGPRRLPAALLLAQAHRQAARRGRPGTGHGAGGRAAGAPAAALEPEG